jgi:signal transduction histidine kinase
LRVPEWVVDLLGTAVIAASLLTARPGGGPLVWLALGAGFAGWLLFLLFSRLPLIPGRHRLTWALAALAGCAVCSAAVSGPAPAEAPTMAALALLLFSSHLRPSGRATLGLAGLVAALTAVSCLLAGRGLGELAVNLAAVVIVLLVGAARRQQDLRAEQAVRLLEQTEVARRAAAHAAALDERARIARELHDVLAHSLGALAVQLEVAEGLLDERGDLTGALHRVRRARRLAGEGLAEARRAVAALRTDPPADGLIGALTQLVAAHRRDHDTEVDLRAEGESRAVPAATAVSLLGAAREALTNCARHAPGAPVAVRLVFTPDAVRLTVTNPAPGSREVGAGDGHGLTGMRERIALAGGTLAAGWAEDDARWQVAAEVPG